MDDANKLIDFLMKILTQSPYVTGFGLFASIALGIAIVWIKAWIKNKLIEEARAKEAEDKLKHEAELPGKATDAQNDADKGEDGALDHLKNGLGKKEDPK